MRHGVIAIALVVAACSKGEPEKTQARQSNPTPVTPAAPAPKSAGGDYAPSEALKERLARQEAAAKLLDTRAPAPARAPEPPPAKATSAAKPPETAKAPPPAAPPKPEPVKTTEPARVAAATPAPAPATPPKSEPAKVETPPPPRTEVAAAKPTAIPTSAIRLVSRVEPDFPREALQAGEEKGLVQARMTLDERGNVTRVEVLESRPRRLFDRSVVRALSQWKYNDGTAGRTVEIEIAFNLR
jgi:protein TonB